MKKLLLFILAGTCVVGCGKKVAETPKESQTFEQFSKSFFSCLENSKTNEAIDKLTMALANDEFKENHGELFRSLIVLKLRVGSVEDAKKLILNAIKDNPDDLKMGLGQVCRYYAENADVNGLLEWTVVLVNAKVPKEYLGTVYSWRMESLYRADMFDDLIAFVPALIRDVTADNAVYVLRRFSNTFLNSGKYEEQEKLLAAVNSAGEGNSVMESFVNDAKINSLLVQGHAAQAEELFKEKVKDMSDGDASASFRVLRKHPCPTAGDPDIIDVFVLENLKDKPQTIKSAAKDWVNSVIKRKKYDKAIVRIKKLMDMSVPSTDILNIYRIHFYAVVGTEDKSFIAEMMKVGDALSEVLDEKGKQAIRALQLDGSFLLEDYATAAKYIEAGIEGRDEEWHKMALNKVKAHLALKEGRIEDAIGRFKEFMNIIKDGKDGEVDPSTGLLYSKEMMLGKNVLRIADLYKSIGKKKESDQAYAEAADYYTKALSNVKPDSKEYALIQSEIKKLPADKSIK